MRENDVALATGFKVVPLSGGRVRDRGQSCQVQVLEPAPGGGVRVVRVWPGDSAHLALWNALMSAESSWGVAPSLQAQSGGEN